ncbi:3',5'-cyclic-nucleotide phosphodiesterase [Aureococcus anophagefferens]|nr:3',5'-cyclic-nucleotide phosphodiesterase [Aureococcus anophagefferens]
MAPGKRRRSRARSISAPAKEAQKDPFAAVEKSRRESQAPRQRTPEPEPEPDDDDDVAVDAVSGATGVTDAVMLNVCTMAKEHLNSDIVTIFLYAPKKRQLWSRWGTNLPSDITTGKTRPIRVPANAGITGQAFSSQEILNVKDAYETAYFNQKVDQMTGYVTRSVLCLPLFRPYDASRPGGGAGAPPMGVVQFINKLAADDDDDDDGGDGGESDDEPADKDHALRLAEKRAVRAAVEDLEDLELASGFGKIASRAIATAIDHDEDRKAREEMKEANKEEEKKANFQSHVSPGGMEAAHTAFKLKQREGELSVKMNAMIRGYLTRRKVVKELKKNGMIVRSITGAAREKTDTMRAKLKDQEKIRKRAFATQQLLRRQKARDQARARRRPTTPCAPRRTAPSTAPARRPPRPRPARCSSGARRSSSWSDAAIAKSWPAPRGRRAALAQDAEDAREAIREAVNVAAYEKEEKFAKNFSAKKVQGMARAGRRSSWSKSSERRRRRMRRGPRAGGPLPERDPQGLDTHARLQRSDPPRRALGAGFTKFQAVARARCSASRRRYGAHETPFGVELEKFLRRSTGPATPAVAAGTPRQPSRTLAEHRRALAEQRRAAQPPPRTGVGNMGTFAPPLTGKVSRAPSSPRTAGLQRGRDDGDVDFRSHRDASTAPRAVSGAYGGGGRQGRIEAQLLAELRDDLAENDVPTLGRVDEALYTATPLASRATTPYSAAKLLTSQLLSTTDEGDDESNDGRARLRAARATCPSTSVSGPRLDTPAPSGDPIYVHSPHKDRWLSAHAGVVKKSFKNDKLYREARRNVSRLVRQNRRLEYTSGLERPATTRTTSLPSPRRLA